MHVLQKLNNKPGVLYLIFIQEIQKIRETIQVVQINCLKYITFVGSPFHQTKKFPNVTTNLNNDKLRANYSYESLFRLNHIVVFLGTAHIIL